MLTVMLQLRTDAAWKDLIPFLILTSQTSLELASMASLSASEEQLVWRIWSM